MATSKGPENPYLTVIKEAGGPFRVEKDAVEDPDLVARALFDYMQRVLSVCDQMRQPPPVWMDCFSKRIADVLRNPELVVQVANAYAAARNQGFVIEPEDPSDTPCGKSAHEVFDEKVTQAQMAPVSSLAPEFADSRLLASGFGFSGSDLRAVWSVPEGKDLLDFFREMRLLILKMKAASGDGSSSVLGVPIEQWRAFLNFKDPLKFGESTAGAGAVTAAADASAEGAPEEAASLPEWVTAEDRWDRLWALYEIFQERLLTSTEYNDIFHYLLTPRAGKAINPHYDVDFLMGFDAERMRAVLPHLIERARLSRQNITLFREASLSWVHCPLPKDSSVHAMPARELVARCWLTDLDGMKEAHVKAVFGGLIHPKTFSVLRHYISEEGFKGLAVEKIQFADRLQRDGTFNAFLKYIGADAFMGWPLDELQRAAKLGVEFFKAVLESPRPDAAASGSEAPQKTSQETPFEQAFRRLDTIRFTDRKGLMDMVLNAQELGRRGRSNDDILIGLSKGRGPTARMVALQLMHDIPVERLAKLPSNYHAALIQHPELADHLLTLEQMPEYWLALAMNAHLKSLPTLDANLLKATLDQQREEAAAAASFDIPAVLAEPKDSRPDVDLDDKFADMVRDFPAKMEALLRCPGPDVLCAFVEHHGVTQAELKFNPPPGSDDDNVALMVHRKACREANHLRGLAAAEPSGGRRPLLRAYTDLPENDVWHETPTRSHSMGSFEFGDFLRHGYTPEELATLAEQHRFVACLVEFQAEQRQAKEEAEAAAEPPDLVEVKL